MSVVATTVVAGYKRYHNGEEQGRVLLNRKYSLGLAAMYTERLLGFMTHL